MFYAHSSADGRRDRWEPLAEHLYDVAERAASFAAAFHAEEEARAAGLLHDLGKAADPFTKRLEGKARGLDHWSAGAWAALGRYRQHGVAAALAIQGHHVGLGQGDTAALRALDPKALSARHPLGLTLTETDTDLLLSHLAELGLTLPGLTSSVYARGPAAAGMLDVRMLFSALVDADYLETEAHFGRGEDGLKRHRPAGPVLETAAALRLLAEHVAGLAAQSGATPAVLALRADLFQACREAGALPPGLFTLTAPTGAGKTLAMLAFALRHAAEHGLRRIVVALPFLAIVEQTAKVYGELLRPAFGEHCVLEHHSLAGTRGGAASAPEDADEARRTARLLAENWDAPLVVTTTVQLLESLLANRPRACRKLHRLAKSVILLDEVQTLPVRLAVPTLATLSRLAERYGATVVFSTATQPAFDHLDEHVRRLAAGGWAPREIVPPELGLFARARRVRVRCEIDRPLGWDELAGRLSGLGTALVIVNLKRHAADLARRLAARGVPGLSHLSTNMCPAHRERVLQEVRDRLDRGEPCLLVSTQCVEAGVDLDFPVVYRALAPLDAIAQAAGRCNRNGRLPGGGEVVVFLPEDEKYPPGGYAQATAVTRGLIKKLSGRELDLQSAELFRRYYEDLYDLTDSAAGAPELLEALSVLDFADVAARYRLIEQDAVNVLVPYDEAAFGVLRQDLDAAGRLTADWIRKARPHTVSLFRPGRHDPIQAALDPAPAGRGEKSDDWFIWLPDEGYDRELLGLTGAPEVWIA